MPLITIHTSTEKETSVMSSLLDKLRVFAAAELSCGTRSLESDEISIRIIQSTISQPISSVELVIFAYSYEERIKNQDKICLSFKKHIESQCEISVFVWLQLSELGHSL